MNRWSSTASKATSTTLCQKCLKRGHYSYECTATQQDRPYVSRPSRTQVLRNPKLAPRVSTVDELSKDTSTSRALDDKAVRQASKTSGSPGLERQTRSPSVSSDSVATISTNQSRSRSRSQSRSRQPRPSSPRVRALQHGRNRSMDNRSHNERGSDRRRRRSSSSSDTSHRHGRDRRLPKVDDEWRSARSDHGKDERSYRETGGRRRSRSPLKDRERAYRSRERATVRQERSLSPYSKRVALSKT